MSETPLPHVEEFTGPATGSRDVLAVRNKRLSMPGRAVSAFAPAHPKSDPPLAENLPLTSEDQAFIAALREAGLVSELHGAEVTRVARHVVSPGVRGRYLDLLFAYYAAAGDALVSRRRMVTDRWFIYSAKQSLNLSQVLGRLLSVLPEIANTRLERVADEDGPLVLRCDEHVCALEDETEEGSSQRSVTIAGVVRALNVLLDRQGVRSRLVGLFGDGTREAYVAIASMAAAVPLAQAGYLTVPDAESLMEQTGW